MLTILPFLLPFSLSPFFLAYITYYMISFTLYAHNPRSRWNVSSKTARNRC